MASRHQSSPSRNDPAMDDLPMPDSPFHYPTNDPFDAHAFTFRLRDRIDSEEISVAGFVPPRKNSEGATSELFRTTPLWVSDASLTGVRTDRGPHQRKEGSVHSLVVPTAT